MSALDWPAFVEQVSRIERILRGDPAGAYADMDLQTRDRYRKAVEQLSKRSNVDERDDFLVTDVEIDAVDDFQRAIAFDEFLERDLGHAVNL